MKRMISADTEYKLRWTNLKIFELIMNQQFSCLLLLCQLPGDAKRLVVIGLRLSMMAIIILKEIGVINLVFLIQPYNFVSRDCRPTTSNGLMSFVTFCKIGLELAPSCIIIKDIHQEDINLRRTFTWTVIVVHELKQKLILIWQPYNQSVGKLLPKSS